MAHYQLIISPAAQNDLKEIYSYGVQNRGKISSDRYLDAIKTQLWHLTEQPEMGIPRFSLQPNLRSIVVNKHVIFYRIVATRVEIIRLLHTRQDVQKHI